MKLYATILLTLLVATRVYAQTDYEDLRHDSLVNVLNSLAPDDTVRLDILSTIGYEHYSVDTVKKYSDILLHDAEHSKYERAAYFKAKALGYLYWCYFHYNDLVKANKYAFDAIAIADSIGNRHLMARNYHNLAIAYAEMTDATRADEYYHRALDIYTEEKDSSDICDALRDIANNNMMNGMYEESEENYKRAMEIDMLRNSKEGISEDHIGLGGLYRRMCEMEFKVEMPDVIKAKNEYLEGLKIADEISYDFTRLIIYAEIPMVMLTEIEILKAEGADNRTLKEKMDSCKMFIDMGHAMADRQGYDIDRLEIDFNMTTYLTLNGEYRRSKEILDSISDIFNNDPEGKKKLMSRLYNSYSYLYKTKGDYKKAFEYQELANYHATKNHKQDYAIKAIQNMVRSNFEQQMKQHEQREILLEAESKQHTIIIISAFIVLFLLTALAMTLVRYYLKSRKVNLELDAKNNALEQQKEEMFAQNERLEEQNERIEIQKKSLEAQNKLISDTNKAMQDSINYASVIQQAAMPSKRLMNSIFGDHMVIFRPLNIVSGDFFWATQTKNLKMLAVADCTGHGVPGAFLSMLGMAILDYLASNIDRQNAEVSAGTMLDEMRRMFKQSLHQRGDDDASHDGIDIALVILDTDKKELHYAGAFRPMVLIHDSKALKVDADRMPIGLHYNESEHFTDHTYAMNSGDVIYLFSDGITDQFGYDEGHAVHKFTAKRLRSMLENIHKLPFSAQQTKLETTFDSWRLDSVSMTGDLYEQTDDAILVGIRI